MFNDEVLMFACILVGIVMAGVFGISTVDRVFDNDERMAKMGYTQATIPGANGIYWVMPDKK